MLLWVERVVGLDIVDLVCLGAQFCNKTITLMIYWSKWRQAFRFYLHIGFYLSILQQLYIEMCFGSVQICDISNMDDIAYNLIRIRQECEWKNLMIRNTESFMYKLLLVK